MNILSHYLIKKRDTQVVEDQRRTISRCYCVLVGSSPTDFPPRERHSAMGSFSVDHHLLCLGLGILCSLPWVAPPLHPNRPPQLFILASKYGFFLLLSFLYLPHHGLALSNWISLLSILSLHQDLEFLLLLLRYIVIQVQFCWVFSCDGVGHVHPIMSTIVLYL